MNAEPNMSWHRHAEPVRVVMDTSALVRYLIRPSAALRAIVEDLWLDDQVQMVTCPELMAGLEEVLRRDYIRALVHADEAEALLEAIRRKAEFLPSLGAIPVYTRDRKDDKFVACAVAGQARYIVTTDQDLLELQALADIRLLTPQAFLEQLADKSERNK